MTIHLNQGHIAALCLALGLAIWMLAGSLSPEQPFHNARPLVLDDGLARVQVERMQGSLTRYDVSFSGHTAANRRVELRSEMRGRIIAVHQSKGARVQAGDLLLELDARDWPARVKQAEANLRQRELEARSAKELAQRGLANEAQLAQAETQRANAEAELTNARIQLAATKVRAPFAGIVDQRHVEAGDFIQEYAPLMVLLDFDPWLIKGQVSERDAPRVRIGDPAWAELADGKRVEGRIRFVSSEADPATRMLTVEMEADRGSLAQDSAISSGLTARIHVPQQETWAYYISPALLMLNDNGQLGLKGIDEQNRVIFRPVDLLKADNRGIWVHGLGAEAQIITVGQGYVDYGQAVMPVYKTADPQTATDAASANTPVLSAE